MKAVHDAIDGPFVIEEDIALYGTITGSATLHSGRRFILRGTIAGDLRVERGARAILHGTVAGRIYNDGGRVELYGIADAVANSSSDTITIIDPAAHVMGRRRAASLSKRSALTDGLSLWSCRSLPCPPQAPMRWRQLISLPSAKLFP